MELKSLAGAAHIVLHKGKCVFVCSGGVANADLGSRFSTRTLCRLHGATKPVLAAAFLTLVDAGKCRLCDPVVKYLPFADWIVQPPAADAGRTCKAKAAQRRGSKPYGTAMRIKARRPATLRDLLTNTAGLENYDLPHANANVLRLVRRGSITDLPGLCEALAKEPLRSCPGRRYDYSFALDILGRVCEVISGKTLDRFMEEDFLRPVGMADTHFRVPQRKRTRAAALYNVRPVGKRRRQATGEVYSVTPYEHPHEAPGILSGGGGILSYRDPGLWASAEDYARFCQMLLAGGVAQGGRRVLRPGTARALWEDALGPLGGRSGRLPGWHDQDGPKRGGWWDYRGLSLLHTFLDLDEPPLPKGKSRRSQSMWFSGGGGVYWTIDARRQLVTVSFTQTIGGREDESDGHGPLAYRIAPYVQ